MDILKEVKEFVDNIDETQEQLEVKSEGGIHTFDWTGLKHTPETIEQMRMSQTGVIPSKETVALLKKQRQNKMWITDGVNDFWVDKDMTIPEGKWRGRSTAKKRAPMSEEQKEKLRQARLGTKHSEETKKKMGLSRMGNQNARKKYLNSSMNSKVEK